MKFLTFILALIVVAASIAPCLDIAAGSMSDKSSELVSFDGNQHQTVGDLCSPFCTCACCVTTADVFSFAYKLDTPAIISPDIPVFNQNTMRNSGISFWQPPKV